MYKGHKISVVIPCYNEEEGIGFTLQKIPGFVDQVVVVDNLSDDKTGKIARKLGAWVVSEKNKGYGSALKTGIDHVKDGLVATVDGDGTYPIENLEKPINYLLTKKLNFVSCSRFPFYDPKSMTWQSIFGNKVISFFVRLLFSKKFKDALSGMWVFKKSIYSHLLPLSSGWSFSEEIKIKARLHPKIMFAEYEIKYYPRRGKSKIMPIQAGLEYLTHLLFLRFRKNGS